MSDAGGCPFQPEDWANPENIANPYPTYDAFRDASPLPGLVDYVPGSWPGLDDPITAWAVLKYDDVLAAARNHKTFSQKDPTLEAAESTTFILSVEDPPEHTRHRKLLNTTLTPTRVEAMRPWITKVVDEIVADLPAGREVDVYESSISDLAPRIVAGLVHADDADIDDFKRWAMAIFTTHEMPIEERSAANAEVVEYVRNKCKERSAALKAGAAPSGFIDSVIIAEEDGGHLTSDEVMRSVFTFIVAGSETTLLGSINLLASAALNPAAFRRVREDRSLIPSFIAETIRWLGPVQRTFRIVTEDTELRGQKITMGEQVGLFWASGNNDPDVFPDPHEFDMDRPNLNRHLGWGNGIHFCIGKPLAHMEFECLLNALCDRFSLVTLGRTPYEKQSLTFLNHSFIKLPLVFHE